jgi:hypothetical protein
VLDPGADVKRADGLPRTVVYGAGALILLVLASSGLLALALRLDREARGT